MSVVSNLRDLSKMEFYKNALRVRHDITLWLMRDFGEKKNPKDLKHTLKDATEAEEKVINEMFEAHNQSTKKEFVAEYPAWFMEDEKERLMEMMWRMIGSIIAANSIYPEHIAEADLRRCKQDEAITAVQQLYSELDYISRIVPQNINYFEPLLNALDKEEHLLKGWRQSDNRRREDIVNKFAEKLSKIVYKKLQAAA